MSIIKFTFVLIFAIFSINLFAQKGIVSGRVIDWNSGQPLEYASVVVYATADSILINGTITGGSGSFKIEKLPNGLFYIRVQFLGYETLQTQGFEVISEGETKIGRSKDSTFGTNDAGNKRFAAEPTVQINWKNRLTALLSSNRQKVVPLWMC